VQPDSRGNASAAACGGHWLCLIGFTPLAAKHQIVATATGYELSKEMLPFVGKNNVPLSASFRLPNMKRSAVGVEISDAKAGDFLVATSSQQQRMNQFTKIRSASIKEPFALSNRRR
jgi:hypothetical protein